jgi:archaemetzincin
VRDQHDALEILRWLDHELGGPGEMVLAIVEVDLFIPVLTFVYGEARLGGRSAVVSTFRLAEGGDGEPCDQDLFLSRVEKEAVHEVGHMLGLTHCVDRNCAMYPSNTLVQTDSKGPRLCPGCHARLVARSGGV